jgi:hypothetical protein
MRINAERAAGESAGAILRFSCRIEAAILFLKLDRARTWR